MPEERIELCGNPDCKAELTVIEMQQSSGYCMDCNAELLRRRRARPLTRNERLQRAADAGFDTWDDYLGNR